MSSLKRFIPWTDGGKRYESIADWPKSILVGNVCGKNESTDFHKTREGAEAVCRLLERNGFGGDREVFPLSTRVEERVTSHILSSESTWREPLEWERKWVAEWDRNVESWKCQLRQGLGGKSPVVPKRPRILVTEDLFAPFDGRWIDEHGDEIWWHYEDGREWTAKHNRTTAHSPIRLEDYVLDRVFRLIDACPNCEWIVPTIHPELARPILNRGFERTGVQADINKRSNVSLAVRCSTQAEADERIREADELRDLVGGIIWWFEPTESIDVDVLLRLVPPSKGVIISGMTYLNIATTRTDGNRRKSAQRVFASHCPFCGAKLESGEAE